MLPTTSPFAFFSSTVAGAAFLSAAADDYPNGEQYRKSSHAFKHLLLTDSPQGYSLMLTFDFLARLPL